MSRRIRRRDRGESLFRFTKLPCLRCGEDAVLVNAFFKLTCRDTIPCRNCDAMHYLEVRTTDDGDGPGFDVVYDRYTQRYDLDSYDGAPVATVRAHVEAGFPPPVDDATVSGPVLVWPRTKRFSVEEVKSIWRATLGRCHLCGKRWRLKDKSRHGWHIDHVIPHVGGGHDTEEMPNFRVACARCNLKKGRGFTQGRLQRAIQQLIADLKT